MTQSREQLEESARQSEKQWENDKTSLKRFVEFSRDAFVLSRHIAEFATREVFLETSGDAVAKLQQVAESDPSDLVAAANEWLVRFGELYATHSEFDLAIQCCKSAIKAFEDRRKTDRDVRLVIGLCDTAAVVSRLYLCSSSDGAAIEAARYAIRVSESVFSDSEVADTIETARRQLADVFEKRAGEISGLRLKKTEQAHTPYEASAQFTVEQILGDEADRLLEPLQLSLGMTTIQHVVGDDPDGRNALGKIIERFVLLEQMGQGGFGVVWKAVDTRLDRIVALKVPRVSELDTSRRKILFNEAKVQARCSHPNIVTVHDIGIEDEVVFIVMEFIEGLSFELWAKRNDASDLHIVRVLLPIVEALGFAHKKGIVHRDVKGQNILVADDDRPVLIDFLPLTNDDQNSTTESVPDTEDNSVVGTPLFMSPEHFEGKAEFRSDLYSLGVVLYEATVRTRPWSESNRLDELYSAKQQPPELPSVLKPSISLDLEVPQPRS